MNNNDYREGRLDAFEEILEILTREKEYTTPEVTLEYIQKTLKFKVKYLKERLEQLEKEE